MYQSASFYYLAANDLVDDGNFSEALLYYNKAISLDSAEYIYMEKLASVYEKIEEYDSSVILYSKVIDYISQNAHKIIESKGKIKRYKFRIFRLTNNLRSIHDYISSSEIEDEEIAFNSEKTKKSGKHKNPIYIDTKIIRNVKLFKEALRFVKKENYDAAINSILKIDKDSQLFPKSRELLIDVALQIEDYDLVENIAREIYENNPMDYLGFSNLIKTWSLYSDKPKEEIELFINNIIKMLKNEKLYFLLNHLSADLLSLGYRVLAANAAKEAYVIKPESSDTILNYTVALFESGKTKKAKMLIDRAKQMFPYNKQVTFAAWFVDSELFKTGVKKFTSDDFFIKCVDEIWGKLLDELEPILLKAEPRPQITTKALDLIEVVFSIGNLYFIDDVLDLCERSFTESLIEILLDNLRDPSVEKRIKSIVLYKLIMYAPNLKEVITLPNADNIFSPSYSLESLSFPKTPRGLMMSKVYARVYSEIIVEGFSFSVRRYKKVADVILKSQTQLKSTRPLCATLLYYYAKAESIMHFKTEIDYLANKFGTYPKIVEKYIEAYRKDMYQVIKGENY